MERREAEFAANKLEQRLERAERARNRFQQLFDLAPVGILELNADSSILEANWAAARLLGEAPSKLFGRRLPSFLHENDAASWQRHLHQVFSLESSHQCELHLADGRVLRVESSPLALDGASESMCLTALVDVTALRETESELREADRDKNEFLARLARELRDPLAPLVDAIQLLGQAKEPGVLQEAGAIVERQARLLVAVVDQLQDVASIARGEIRLDRAPVVLQDVVHSALQTTRPLTEQNGLQVQVTLAEEALRVHGDPIRLAQIMASLLERAARSSEPGGRMEIAAQRDGARAVLTVRDHGIGIPPRQAADLLDLFHASPTARLEGGLGVGLALAGQLARLHGGRLEVTGHGANRGSTLSLSLPLLAEPHTGRPAARLHVIVVDDNEDAARSVAMLLGLAGHQVRVATSGAEALRMVEDRTPHAAILDLGMPGMSGFALAEELRERLGRELLLVALTGWGDAEHREQAARAGFDHHLTKPASPATLNELLAAHRLRLAGAEPGLPG